LCIAKYGTVWKWRRLKHWSIFIPIVVFSAKDLVPTLYATVMVISSWRNLMVMVEHSQRWMMTTTMTMVAKAMMAVMEMLLTEEKKIAKNTFYSILEMCAKNATHHDEIDEEVANNIDGHAAVGSIGNMHVNEDAVVGSVEHGYDLANEELDDDDYNDVANDHGEENENKCGCTGDSNDRGEDGTTGTMVSGSSDAAPIGNRDGGTSNASEEEPTEEEPTEEDPNQGVEIQDNPPPFDTNVNSQVPNIVILAMGNADEDDDVLLNEMFPTIE
jgi:hypothetical protein